MSTSMARTRRAKRLIHLYELRGKVVSEIAELEAEIDAEAAVVRRQSALEDAADEQRKRTRRRTAECGTDGGYHHHLRIKKEAACMACRMAHSAVERDRARRRREAS